MFKTSYNLESKKFDSGAPVVSTNVRVKLPEEATSDHNSDQDDPMAEQDHQTEMRKTR
jgi:hypothetical protein